MTNPRDPDTGLEELLRNALQGEADGVSPRGDGLARIQQRVSGRRARRMWLRPVAVVGAAAVVAAAGFTAYAVTSHPRTDDSLVSKQPPVIPTASVTPSVTPSKTAQPAPVFPAGAFYPFSSAAEEQSWEAQKGPVTQSWLLDPVAAAKSFVANFVGVTDVATVIGSNKSRTTATVTLGRTIHDASSGRPIKVTTVQLVRFGKAWLVVGAGDPTGFLKLSSPAGGARITSPVTVSGPSFGVEEAVDVDVRAIGHLTLGQLSLPQTTGHVTFGNGSAPWSATVGFTTPADPRGAIVATETSPADGGTSRIVVRSVVFAGNDATGYPSYFYAIKNGRVTKFSSRTGAAISYLTPPEPGGGASDPKRLRDNVYYLSGSGTCANSLRSVGINGGATSAVATPDAGYVITGYALGYNLGLYETACDPSTTSPAAKLVFKMPANDPPAPADNTATFDALPPVIVGNPSWADDRHVIAILQTGMNRGLHDYDSWTVKKALDGSPSCGGNPVDGEPDALQVDTGGNLWFAVRTGSSMRVVRCVGDFARVMFTVSGNLQPADISVAGSGGAVLLTDITGNVWRWNQGGDVTKLAPSVPIMQLSW